MRHAGPVIVLSALALLPCGASRGDESSFATIARGRYLVNAGDCVACHTAPDGKPFAGGLGVQTPFGIIYSPNITPDRETGIGGWSADQFYRAMHDGVDAKGHQLYPAFPYPWFTHVKRADVDAIRAYLSTLPPVKNRPPSNKLPWPLSVRFVMKGWNWLFFKPGTFKPDASKSVQWNRGAYLVQGLGHCGACHAPKNFLGADENAKHLSGYNLQDWFAPNLDQDKRTGLGDWSIADIVQYLGTGRNAHNNASGPMADVVEHSTSRLSHDDLVAIATYLKNPSGKSRSSSQQTADESVGGASVPAAGKAIYVDECSECHSPSGGGVPGIFPALKGNAAVVQKDPTSVIHVILEGARTAVTDRRPTPFTMPAFDWKLDNAQIAAVATYVRNVWGNRAGAVSAGEVGKLRASAGQGASTRP